MAKATKVVKKEKVVTPDVSKEPVVIETKTVVISADKIYDLADSPMKWVEPKAEVPELATEPIVQQPVAQIELVAEISMEEAILAFVESRNTPEVRLNEFLKSLYGVPQGGKQKHEHITELRYLRSVLAGLDGKLFFTSRQFLTLGNTKYEGVEMKAKKITLNDINIVVKK